jgi:hypothetical protein
MSLVDYFPQAQRILTLFSVLLEGLGGSSGGFPAASMSGGGAFIPPIPVEAFVNCQTSLCKRNRLLSLRPVGQTRGQLVR